MTIDPRLAWAGIVAALLLWLVRRLHRADRSGRSRFHSPDELHAFALDLAARLDASGFRDLAHQLRSGATYPTSSGWEWLGELAATVRRIGPDCPQEFRRDLDVIGAAASSRRPYG